MNCAECKELLAGFLEGLLDESERHKVSEHLRECPSCSLELTKFEKMHERLLLNGKAFSESDFEENVFNRIIREQKIRINQAGFASRTISFRRLIMKSPITKIAAAAAVMAVATFFFLGDGQESLYAKAMKAFEQARSIHAVGYKFLNGQIADSMELWYQQGTGTRLHETRKGITSMIVDNGKNQWWYIQGNDFAVQRTIYSKITLPQEIMEISEYVKDCKRAPEGDVEIGGDLCKLYVRENTENEPIYISKTWIDEQNRCRKYEQQRLIDGIWQTSKQGDIFYEETIEPKIFTADFGSQIKIVTPDQAMKNLLSLENAIAVKEVYGLIFAVHDLKKYDKYIFVNCSVRPTKETLQQIESYNFGTSESNDDEYGDFQLTDFWQRKETGELIERPYGIAVLGKFSFGGMYAAWYALLPKGQWPEADEKYDLCSYIHTRGRLQKMRSEQGLKTYGLFRPLLTLNIPNENTAIEEIAGDIYEIFKPLSCFYNGKFPLEPNPLILTQNDFIEQVYSKLDGIKPVSDLWKETGQNIEIRLVDSKNKPVVGAKVGGGPQHIRNYDGNLKWYTHQGEIDCLVSNENGVVVIKGEQLFSPDTSRNIPTLIYAVKEQEQLVGTREIISEDFGKKITIKMQPACRVTAKFTCPELENTNDSVKLIKFLLTSDEFSSKSFVHTIQYYATEQMTFNALLIPGRYCISSPGVRTSNGNNFYTVGKYITVPKNQTAYDLGDFILKSKE